MSDITLEQIAKKAGVSVGTVSRVLNGKNKENWKSTTARAERIRNLAKSLDYRPNAAARAMRMNQSLCVGIVVRNNPEERFVHVAGYEMILGINEGLDAAGYMASFIRVGDVEKGLRNQSRFFREDVVDGAIVVGGLSSTVETRVSELVSNCIWLDCNTWRPVNCIRRDEFAAGRTAAMHQAELGYRRLVWLSDTRGVPEPHYSQLQRFEGVLSVVNERGLHLEVSGAPKESLMRQPEKLRGWFVPECTLIADSTYCARWAAHTAATFGLVPGHHFGLACCDDSHDLSVQWPGLSRVHVDLFELGRMAARMMVAALENNKTPQPSVEVRGEWYPGDTAWGPR